MAKISAKHVLYLTVTASVLSIVVSMLTLTGQFAILNTNAVAFLSPSEGAKYNVNDTVTVSVIFSPHLTGVDAPVATGYYLIAKVGNTVLYQDEATGTYYTTSFSLTRYFTSSEVGNIIITATMTISGVDYYNDILVTFTDDTVVPTTTTEEIATTETTPSFEITIAILCLIIFLFKKKLTKKEMTKK